MRSIGPGHKCATSVNVRLLRRLRKSLYASVHIPNVRNLANRKSCSARVGLRPVAASRNVWHDLASARCHSSRGRKERNGSRAKCSNRHPLTVCAT